MRSDAQPIPLAAVACCLVLSGCQVLGPESLDAGREAYNDVIARTNSQQMLGLLVRLRYGDPFGLLSVSNVTANLKFSARAGGEAGIGSKSNYEGNLVPFSAGVTYEDSPTISYVPVDSQAFLAQWLKPISLDTVILSTRVAKHGSPLFALLVGRLNELRSDVDASPAERARFARALALLDELHDLGVATWVVPTDPHGAYELVLSAYAPSHTAGVEELLALLGTRASTRGGAAIRIPVARIPSAGASDLALETRSVGEVLLDAALAIEVPAEHLEAGVVAPSPPGLGEHGFRIHSSEDAPSHASLAVQHRGYWYYVDDTDLPSKQTFQQLQLLFSSALAEASAGSQAAPVLTIPVN